MSSILDLLLPAIIDREMKTAMEFDTSGGHSFNGVRFTEKFRDAFVGLFDDHRPVSGDECLCQCVGRCGSTLQLKGGNLIALQRVDSDLPYTHERQAYRIVGERCPSRNIS